MSFRFLQWTTPTLRGGVSGVGQNQMPHSVNSRKEAGKCTGLSSVPGATASDEMWLGPNQNYH